MHLKIKKMDKNKTLLQIIDMSDKILYNEVKAGQKFSELMNAALSHELRNPLNSLTGGIDTMKSYLANIQILIENMQEKEEKSSRN